MNKPDTPWSLDVSVIAGELSTDAKHGLSSGEAERRLKDAGENKITHAKPITFWDILLEEIKEPLILLLLVIGVMYSIWGDIGDAITIIFVIFAVAMVEVYTEYKAKKSIESLKTLSQPTSWVIRENRPTEIPAGHVVPGDILILKSGVKVSADARVLTSFDLETDESQLTGEAMGVAKTAAPISAGTGLNDHTNMVHMGSIILKGKGTAMVTATGMDTELGRIAGLTGEVREPKTPLQKSMKQLSKTLIWAAAFFSVLVFVLGLLRGFPLPEMILTGLSFAFATIPEEMPIIITMVLGLGAIHLSKKNVLIKRTKAAETLGSVTVIATDKTGTLTENNMSIGRCYSKDEVSLFTYASLLADVEFDGEGGILGDPMDRAVVREAEKHSIHRAGLLREYPLVRDYGFDETAKTFTSQYRKGDRTVTLIKGAPESVFSLSEQDEEMQRHLDEAMAAGLRTIAVAFKEDTAELYTLAGIISFDDPVRDGVREAIDNCYTAGVKVVMITGDHGATAIRVAKNAGIRVTGVLTGEDMGKLPEDRLAAAVKDCNVFARISPEQKFFIVKALQENREVVAVTGDGINDAPALKAADIGISLGITGTDVAKEASDMILQNDSFASIVTAIEEGRRLYDNLTKCVKYYLACKIGLILCILLPMLLGIPLPFSPIQIIILELFMDLAASTSFVVEKAESDVLKRKPRDPEVPFMNRKMILGIVSGGVTLAAIVLGIYLFALGFGDANARTLAFASWLLGHVVLAFNMRTEHVPVTRTGIFSSRMFNIWMGGVIVFLLAALNIPALRTYLQLNSIGIVPVLWITLTAVLATLWMEIRKIITWKA